MTRAVLILLAVVGFAVSAAPAAHARASIGIGDQKPGMFTDPRFKALGIRYARLNIGWDALASDWQREEIDTWMGAARDAGVEPLVTFGHSRTTRRLLPTPSRFKYEVRRFRERYPWVDTFATWNEANHCGEPTCHRAPLVAAYYKALRRECRGCTVLAAELLDMPNMTTWARQFRKAAGREPEVWGLHNYVDTNRFRTKSTRQMLRAVRGDIWLTEVGGLVRRQNKSRIPLNESPTHAVRALNWLFKEILPISPRLSRVYIYHWQAGGPEDTWDSALLTPGGRTRGAFDVVKRQILARRRA
ncbi:MAG: hypothetical protein JHC95_21925 [Solirubrobacteraceae bacterium]|nr:hypothetical protein [Solirubrobacteraceae bacterium]